MLRLATAALVLMLTAPVAAQVTGSLPPVTPSLKRDVTVSGELVRIGDLVENAGASARIPIFRAPDLGQTGSVSAARVIEAVRAHGLALVETRGISDIAVTRLSRVVSAKDLTARIAAALAAQAGVGDARNLSVTFDQEPQPIQLEPSVRGELQVARLFYDPRTSRFDISLAVPEGAGRRLALRYLGTAIETVEAAVLTRPLNRGDVVKASDLVIERRPKGEFRNEGAMAIADAAGLAARRALRAGDVLRSGDLMKPDIVQRNDTVTLVYEAPGLMLTMRGKAMDSGAQGDLISVLNVQSKRTVQGTITAPGQVTIAAATPRAVRQPDAPAQPQPRDESPR
jgi:flagella basal body P-ring formation protein FlgA